VFWKRFAIVAALVSGFAVSATVRAYQVFYCDVYPHTATISSGVVAGKNTIIASFSVVCQLGDFCDWSAQFRVTRWNGTAWVVVADSRVKDYFSECATNQHRQLKFDGFGPGAYVARINVMDASGDLIDSDSRAINF
jgi:hypothetical protein